MKLSNKTVNETWQMFKDFIDAVEDEMYETCETISNLRAELDAANEKIEELEEKNEELTEQLEELDEETNDKKPDFEGAFYLAKQLIDVLRAEVNRLREELNALNGREGK